MRARLIGLLALLLALPTALHAQASDPVAVITALVAAANAHDLEATMALFADDAVVQIRPEALGSTSTGKDAVRKWFSDLYAGNFSITVADMKAQGNTVTDRATISSDGLRQLGLASLDGNEEYTVRDGKIVSMTFTYTDDSLAKLQAAVAAAQAAQAPQALPRTGGAETALWLLALGALLAAGAGAWLLKGRRA